MIDYTMPNADYHAHPAISKSGLDRINQSPAHYRAWLTEPRKETPALALGSAAHAFILERDSFFDRYAVAPEGIDRRTKDGKSQWAEFDAQANGKTVIKAEDLQQIDRMAASVWAHESARELLSEGRAEVSVFANLWGVDTKCRPDWLREDGLVMDLKTTDDASAAAFPSSVAKWRYHVQAALYQDILATVGIKVSAFVFCAVEKNPPHAVGVYLLDDDAIEAGREAYQRNLNTYKTCIETGSWPAYSPAIETLTLPRWAFQQAA